MQSRMHWIRRMILLTAMIFFGLAASSSQATNLFFDNFDDLNYTVANWQYNGVNNDTGYYISAPNSIRWNNTDWMVRNQSTAGYKDIVLAFWFKTRNFDWWGDEFYIQYSTDGQQSWNTLETVTINEGWLIKEYNPLPAAANNNPNFAIRLLADVNSSDYIYIDEVRIDGTAIPSYTLSTATSGQGSVSLNPSGGTYLEGTQVTMTANADTNWAFDHWSGDASGSENPKTITMDANKSVTAHFVESYEPILTININGTGTVTADPQPPYTLGQQVKLSFSPSSGQQMVSKPSVPPSQPGDPNEDWVFSHWSFNTTTPNGTPGALDNPATITMDDHKTVYVTFLQKGTGAHMTSTQESQLMDIARSIWSGWNAMTQAQADELYQKAENYLNEARTHNMKWGQPATIFWNDFERTAAGGYDVLGEGTTWAGVHLTALCLKHAVNPSDQQTLDDIDDVLDALDRNTLITGTPGWVSRFSGPSSDPAYYWYYSNVSSSVGAYQGASPWTDYTWLGHPTRDTHTGLFMGLASVLELCDDNQTLYNKAATIAERVVDRLIADNWIITDGHCFCEFNLSRLEQLQKRVAYRANPTKYSGFWNDISGYNLDLGTPKSLYDSDYWTDWMGWGQAWGIALLETDPVTLQGYKDHFKAKYDQMFDHLNPFYVGVVGYFDNGQLPAWHQASLEGLLLGYPDGIYWQREVDLHQDARYTYQNADFVQEAAPTNQRVHVDFDGQRSAADALGGNNDLSYQLTNFAMYLTYWMGRASGKIPAPAP